MNNIGSGLLQDCCSAYTLPFDTTEDCVTVRSPRNCYEIGSIPVGENGAGMAQVQSQLATLTIQLQELVKGKEK
jgi:hypothetical protein